ncbi:MAG: carbohydrate-binding family V/XII [Gammaproteobacteria bacterium]
MRHPYLTTIATLIGLYSATPAFCQDEPANPWPREIQVPQGTVVIYQPQPQTLDGNQLDARAAVAVELKDSEAPVFGAVWFTARLETDRAERTATLADISVTRTRFPEQNEAKAARLKNLLETEIPKWGLSISMERLLATLEIREQQIEAISQISTDAPVILFLPEPAVLITLDGEARLKKEEGSDLMRVINTPFTVLLDSKKKTYYLNADAQTWYTATDIEGDWTVAFSVPKEIAALAPEPEPVDEEDLEEEEIEPGPPPKIVLATEPTELISSTGEPEYTPISGTDLLYMSNTDSDMLLHLTNQQHYVLLAGRWYTANSLDGPWWYVPGEELPQDFANIPEDNQMGTVLYAVPGTALAEEAVLDAQLPQTATIERKKAGLDVEYDGDPEFEEIQDTTMEYAANTPTPVIHAGASYYAVDDAVWFVSSSATGPWVVATSIPDVVYTIPPTSPVYHVTYVRIYSYTDEVVYIGYLPGYTGTYVYNTTIIYGTGYYYPGWYRHHYYPRYSTWGFHVRYNPWGGWSFGLSYSSGPFTFHIGRGGWYRGGWWGPGRYRGYRHGYRHGYRRGRQAGYRAGYRAGQRNANPQNMYNSQRNQARTTTQSQGRNQAGATAASGRANNVYADRDGNVNRRTDAGGWEQKTRDGWQGDGQRFGSQPTQSRPDTATSQPSQRPASQPSSRPSSGAGSTSRSQQLDSSYSSRQRGTQRTNSYKRSSGGARRGGGRRR